MLRYVRAAAVRRLIREKGKLAGRTYLTALDLRLEALVVADVASIGSRKILNAAEAQLRRDFNKAVTARRPR